MSMENAEKWKPEKKFPRDEPMVMMTGMEDRGTEGFGVWELAGDYSANPFNLNLLGKSHRKDRRNENPSNHYDD